MSNEKKYFVVFKNPLDKCYYFDLEENWNQHKRYCVFITIVDSAQEAQEICTNLEKNMSYDNNNSGAIFRNDRKQKDADPEYKGSVTVGGAEYWVSVWVNETKDGRKYFSHKYTPKNATAQHQASLQAQTAMLQPKKLEEPNFGGGEDLPF